MHVYHTYVTQLLHTCHSESLTVYVDYVENCSGVDCRGALNVAHQCYKVGFRLRTPNHLNYGTLI